MSHDFNSAPSTQPCEEASVGVTSTLTLSSAMNRPLSARQWAGIGAHFDLHTDEGDDGSRLRDPVHNHQR